ncbi:twin-arginine translocase TatA/TatE family subunit [Helicobacter kayseriensis]|uniref:twin-arginine translocase TatA/TatE family subunit n=1 Tax=Helicobacter kayseriensis TaxID=2905877 RepID=UPI001E5A68D1|nr:twin-arginine translocase TatA/TatE family subunit [Helicobacter kayseriensis]MCE3047668.1 twin-arginine translocase TatA/TatE family subunit [Helicobacter kayseriensis]MCE3049094.1 twin-arginine translocase TatA/TatE family subunit [Helicobacter kayseriensis]
MAPSATQILVVLLIVILLFGAKKIPELAKGMGSGIKNFKKAMKEDEDEEIATKNVENKAQDNIQATTKTEEKQA